jgi:hypothetical protein
MEEKTITITIDEKGKFDPRSCWLCWRVLREAFEDFRGGDRVKLERKKPAYYTNR